MTAASTQPIARIYVRISKAQDGSILGVERQKPPCEEFCQSEGWPVAPELYVDNNTSAWREGVKRDDFERLLRDVRADHRAGRRNAIVTWQGDRLLRTVEDASAIVVIAKECGTLVANIGGSIDLGTADGRRRFYEMAVAAQYESELKSERLKLKHGELRRNGHWQGGQRPFGYDLEEYVVNRKIKVRLVTNPAEAKEIRDAAQRVIRGGSTSGVQRDWAKRGVRRPNGGLFTGQHIRDLLISVRLTGRRRGQDLDAAQQWPAILTVAEHEALAARLGPGRKPRGERGEPIPRRYLLVGFAHCAAERDGKRCGAKLRSKASEGKRRYVCETRFGGCDGIKVAADPLEDHVRDAVIAAFDDEEMGPAIRGRLAARLTDPLEEQELTIQVEADRRRLDQLADDYADDVFASREQFERANRRVERRIAEARARLDEIQARGGILVDLPEGADAMRRAWDTWDLEERRQVIGLAVERVWVKRAGPGRRFTADRAPIDWRPETGSQ